MAIILLVMTDKHNGFPNTTQVQCSLFNHCSMPPVWLGSMEAFLPSLSYSFHKTKVMRESFNKCRAHENNGRKGEGEEE